MYRAKEAGGGRLMLFDEVTRHRALTRLHTERAMRQAIEREEFRVFFQSEVSVDDGSIVGVEALLRWEHPERGLLAPEEFISLAEETGLILPIGAWVLRESCRRAQSWQAGREAETPLVLRVNVSARQIVHDDLPALVADVLEDTGLDPAHLCLEVTESILIEDPEASIKTLAALKRLGSSQDIAIVGAVIELGHALNLSVTAERVETAEQLANLGTAGCDTAQGFLFSRPEHPDIVERLLLKGAAGAAPSAQMTAS